MRELEVLRVESDGQYVVCIDRANDEHFRIRADDELRAAARADTTELGQMPVAGDAALRPREIQSRIRAGASVAELAEIAGVSASKIDRYAHPVLLERARAAELARASHPMSMDGPLLATLGELVAECLVLRGEVPADARWDSWKTQDGQWVVQVSFHVGSTENFGHWRFYPGTHGGTTEPIDELAVELTDPELARTARRTRLAAVPRRTEPVREVRADGHEQVTVDANSLIETQQTRPQRRIPPAQPPAPVSGPVSAPPPLADVLDLQYSSPPAAPQASEPEPAAATGPPAPGIVAAEQGPRATGPQAVPTPRELAERKRPTGDALEARPAGTSKHRAKRAKPAVPAWEDVLLGVRAHPDD